MRRVGVLIPETESDPEGQRRITAFRVGLRELGWAEGRNVRIDYRWGARTSDLLSAYAAELVSQTPEV
jgi:putative tryptophan/tyrosine transport system substrate-binding protein